MPKYPHPYENWLTIKEATSKLTTVGGTQYTRRLIKEGKLKAIRLSNLAGTRHLWIVDPASIERYNEAGGSRVRVASTLTVRFNPSLYSKEDFVAALEAGVGPQGKDEEGIFQWEEPVRKERPRTSTAKGEEEPEDVWTARLLEEFSPEKDPLA